MADLRIADYVPYPGGRYTSDGPYSGQWFRESILRPALDLAIQKDDVLVVNLDGVPGYGISFIEEGFGGLIREDNYVFDVLMKHLKVVSTSHQYDSYERISRNVLINAEKIRASQGG
ncbi:STAS-like domain-containing protein [Gluconacetobacter aggeris]|uniref:STAS-like domain-containing protein n=1 Tax=Gluconacetobacter aggeris TaxID=1286186 RepID=A0A7W4IQU4_9PROT|nr:STAS-like domain-containing protein [Gluconacetobacter aggeris]MBB2167253.1 STAS-like domain-containing protein [Gluconacetobacter aggeris]